MSEITVGQRLVCSSCGSEAIVVVAGNDAELTCCGTPLVAAQ